VRKATPHLLPALLAVLMVIGFLAIFSLFAVFVELKSVNVIAPRGLRQAFIGSVLQEAALQQPDLLPVFGTSEIYNEVDENSAPQFFQSYPTGFTVFEVAAGGVASLEMAQNIAALAPEIRGKKVVISYTPSMFTIPQVDSKPYTGDFSRLHANEMIFSPYISLGLKQRAASRMVEYPDTFAKDPVLGFALQNLAAFSPFNTFLYNLCVPAGWVQTQVIRLQDHWEVISWLYSHPQDLKSIPRKTYPIDWKAEIATAESKQSQITTNNPYGVENNSWDAKTQKLFAQQFAPGSEDQYFIQDFANSKEWEDFDILLSALKETGAEPLLLGRPFNGTMENARGVSLSARQIFYTRVQKAAQTYGIPLIDFSDQDSNKLFSIDMDSHTSRVGWIYVDQALDIFYHLNN
jgi:D-alanine transfer protein